MAEKMTIIEYQNRKDVWKSGWKMAGRVAGKMGAIR